MGNERTRTSVKRPRPAAIPPRMKSLEVSRAGDSAERTADALAADSRCGSAPVMRPSTAAPTDDLLGASGSPLPGPLAGDFGRRFGHDFGRVRVFHDDKAADAADAFNAAAFTVGQ